jgi:hypothetical protein
VPQRFILLLGCNGKNRYPSILHPPPFTSALVPLDAMEPKLTHIHCRLLVLTLLACVSQSMIPGFQTCTAAVAGGGGIGEGGPATAATIGNPSGLWASTAGVYIADSVLHSVRLINRTTNVVRTVFGSPAGKSSVGLTDYLNSPSQIVGDSAGNHLRGGYQQPACSHVRQRFVQPWEHRD